MTVLPQTIAPASPIRWKSNTLVWPGLLIGLAGLPLIASEPLLVQVTQTLIFILFAASLNILVGYGGMVSMGHAALLATGGYTAGLLCKDMHLGMAIAAPIAILAAGAVAAVIGAFAVRLSQSYFIMLTLAFAQLVYVVLWKWREVT